MRYSALAKASTLAVWLFLGGNVLGQQQELIWLGQLAPGDRLDIRTSDLLLRTELIDPETGQAHISVSRDGVHFGPAERVYLLGATAGRHPEGLMVVRMGCIQIGKRLELAVGDYQPENRRLTGPVQQVQIYRQQFMALP